jgi:hypothetical protein
LVGETTRSDKWSTKVQLHPFQEAHVDVTNWLHLLNRSVTPPLPRKS